MATGSQNFVSDKARILSTNPGSDKLWRGDNSWSNTLEGEISLLNLNSTDDEEYAALNLSVDSNLGATIKLNGNYNATNENTLIVKNNVGSILLDSDTEINNTLYLTSTVAASGIADNRPPLIIGNVTSWHLELSDSGIISKSSSNTTGTLYLNFDGGLVQIGSGGLMVSGKTQCTWLRVINNSSNNADDAMVYLENKSNSDWGLKINCDGYNYGINVVTSSNAGNAIQTNGIITGSLLKSTLNGNTVTIGSQNNGWCHIYNSANIGFIFNNNVATTSGNLGTSDYRWNNSYFKGTMYFNHGYINGAATNGGMNLIMTGDDAWIGDCNVGGCFGVRSANSGTVGIHFYNNSNSWHAGYLTFSGTGFGLYYYGAATGIIGTGAILDLYGDPVRVLTRGGASFHTIQATQFQVVSSKLVKTNIRSIQNQEAKKILSLNPIIFDYKDFFGGQKNQIGLIAEEVDKILPYLVYKPKDYNESDFNESKGINQPTLSLDYSKFVPYLIKLAQIQQKEIDDLKLQLKQL